MTARAQGQQRDQRREQRRQASGAVEVRFSDPHARLVEGMLMDLSANGFRMAHSCQSLPAGQLVEFSHHEAAGKARVMWNRITDERVETGFLLVR